MAQIDIVPWANMATYGKPTGNDFGNLEVLANAIALQAVHDWEEAKRILRAHPKREDMKRMVMDCERFFRSSYFEEITGVDGREVLRRLCECFMTQPGKLYYSGMYGGKFMPMHKGHLHCLEAASKLCDHVYLICTLGGADEARIRQQAEQGELMVADFLTPGYRLDQIQRAAAMFPNVKPLMVDLSQCRDKYGNEDWDMETPIILEACGEDFDAVFGSEESYAPYFHRAYKNADYILVDCDRRDIPISATKIRNMTKNEAREWIV